VAIVYRLVAVLGAAIAGFAIQNLNPAVIHFLSARSRAR